MCFQGLETDGCVFRAQRLTGVFLGLRDWCVFRAYRLMGVFSGLTAILRVQGVWPAAVAQREERGAKPPGDVLGTCSAE